MNLSWVLTFVIKGMSGLQEINVFSCPGSLKYASKSCNAALPSYGQMVNSNLTSVVFVQGCFVNK